VTFRLELDHLPDSKLSPNARLHYMLLYKAKREAKEEAYVIAKKVGVPDKPYHRVHITITYVSKDKRRRDMDNLLASTKPTIDGIVAAKVIEDDSVFNVSYSLYYEVGDKAKTIIEIEEIG
jgi:crossover junction endodeoxyribonuclease RusA